MKSASSRHFSTKSVGDVTVVTLLNRELLDDATNDAVRDDLNQLVDERRPARLIINLENVHGFVSRFLGTLMALRSRLNKIDGRMKICCITPILIQAFYGGSFMLGVCGDEQAALDAFQ